MDEEMLAQELLARFPGRPRELSGEQAPPSYQTDSEDVDVTENWNTTLEVEEQRSGEVFRAPGEPMRLEIIWLLRHGSEAPSDIATALDLAPSTVSHHLRRLEQAGMVVVKRRGRLAVCVLNEGVEELLRVAGRISQRS